MAAFSTLEPILCIVRFTVIRQVRMHSKWFAAQFTLVLAHIIVTHQMHLQVTEQFKWFRAQRTRKWTQITVASLMHIALGQRCKSFAAFFASDARGKDIKILRFFLLVCITHWNIFPSPWCPVTCLSMYLAVISMPQIVQGILVLLVGCILLCVKKMKWTRFVCLNFVNLTNEFDVLIWWKIL